ncbi:MAG: glycosyltransferase [Halothece sp. Uz-M2-17]|nr:glycosyltransferase [Halothece sp. Uz-M2-17]
MESISVIIPTYRRSQDLIRCLGALKKQTRQATEIIIVIRDTDAETWNTVKSNDFSPLNLLTVAVSPPGVIEALNQGLDRATGDMIALTDDDAMPHPDWLARLEQHFLFDPEVGGVGGRDLVYHGTQLTQGTRKKVGQLQWFGRIIGNHHLGIGEAREVDLLKGVNMSFRRQAIAGLHFDQRLRGTGAQVHWELAFSLAVKRRGWKLIYDPAILVNHYPAQRFDEDQRRQYNDLSLRNAIHNETLALLDHLSPLRRLIFILWAIAIGKRSSLGFVQWLRFFPQERSLASQKWVASMRGRWQGWQTWQQTKKSY